MAKICYFLSFYLFRIKPLELNYEEYHNNMYFICYILHTFSIVCYKHENEINTNSCINEYLIQYRLLPIMSNYCSYTRLARTWSCWHSLWVFGNPYIIGDTLCNYLCEENTNPFTLTYNIIYTGMDENQQQSKVNKSADEVVSSIVNIFLANYALVVKWYMLC